MTSDAMVERLRNLGPQSSQWLREVGIRTIADLQSIGAVGAYRLVKQNRGEASLNLLWALAAGLQGKDWRELEDSEKVKLRRDAGE